MTWQEFEEAVRAMAAIRWSRACMKETIDGIEIDGVIKLDDAEYILIQITKNETLQKFRKDILDLDIVRRSLFDKYINVTSYIITEDPVSSLMVQTAQNKRVKAITFTDFKNSFFNYSSYYYERSKMPFGSAVVPETGDKENNRFITVGYLNKLTGQTVDYRDIVRLLKQGKKIILKGEYGTGKSRLMQHIFEQLNGSAEDSYVLAIDLRDYKGVVGDDELIRRHLKKYGFSAFEDAGIKCLNNGLFTFLIDGFDEVAIQSWSENPQKIIDIRYQELAFLRQLTSKSRKGLIITGREHFFNDDEEMVKALGLKHGDFAIFESKKEFTDDEVTSFKQENNIEVNIPTWFPKKPMAIRLLSESIISDEIKHSLTMDNPYYFWCNLFDYIAERDSAANKNILDPDSIKKLLVSIATYTRNTEQNTGPISLEGLNKIFKELFGHDAIEESAAYLQRLPGMGRVKSDSYDRQFTDEYFIDFLRVENYRSEIDSNRWGALTSTWKNILTQHGIRLLSGMVLDNGINIGLIIGKIKNKPNSIMALELICAGITNTDQQKIDFGDLIVTGGECSYLDLSEHEICGLILNNCYIYDIDVTNSSFVHCDFESTYFSKVTGVSSKNGLPDCFKDNCVVESCEQISSIAKVKRTKLNSAQQYLVLILQKIFNQRGAGRKEEVLLRGFHGIYDPKLAKKILNLLCKEDVLTTHIGDEGTIYKANRKYQPRAEKILEELSLSKDSIWLKVTALG